VLGNLTPNKICQPQLDSPIRMEYLPTSGGERGLAAVRAMQLVNCLVFALGNGANS
jgi:hypothetical protein